MIRDPLIDTVLDEHLKLLTRLGSGGMSVVYKAEDLLLKRLVAVKMLHPHAALDHQNVLRFRQEAMAASKIKHPNVISVHSFGIPEFGQPYLVMDLIEGQSLAEFIAQNGPIDMRRAVSLMGYICDGLQCAHDAGVVHRDLKPGNIMLMKDAAGKQTLKIVDFGIAKIFTEGNGHALTQTGEVFGSPLYMSPEQCFGKPLDLRSDLYSLACMMFEMCTGVVPIKGGSLLETIHLQTVEPPPPAASKYPGIKYGAEFDQIMRKAMEKNPAERFQSASEFKTALTNMVETGASTTNSEETTSCRKLRLTVVTATALLIGTSAMVYFIAHRATSLKRTWSVPPIDQPRIQSPATVNRATVNQPPVIRSPVDAPIAAGSIFEKRTTNKTLQELYKRPNAAQPSALSIENSEVTDDGLRVLTANNKLRTLQAKNSRITELSAATIGSLTNLEKIDVSNTAIGDNVAKSMSGLKNLWHIWAPGTKISDQGAAHLVKLANLHSLSLSETNVTNSSVEKLSALNLKELRLSHCKITGASIHNLERMQSLTKLVLMDDNIGDEGAKSISKLANLQSLSLDGTGLTDDGVKALSHLHNLKKLTIGRNQLTDQSLEYLPALPNLVNVTLNKTNISRVTMDHYRQNNPGVHVVD